MPGSSDWMAPLLVDGHTAAWFWYDAASERQLAAGACR